jgi:hypothetical protein
MQRRLVEAWARNCIRMNCSRIDGLLHSGRVAAPAEPLK